MIIARAVQYGIIGSLERFFTWYGCLVATYPKTSIILCILATVGGGLGLLRFVKVVATFAHFSQLASGAGFTRREMQRPSSFQPTRNFGETLTGSTQTFHERYFSAAKINVFKKLQEFCIFRCECTLLYTRQRMC